MPCLAGRSMGDLGVVSSFRQIKLPKKMSNTGSFCFFSIKFLGYTDLL